MPNYRRARSVGGIFFFTVVTFQRQPFLAKSPYEKCFWTIMHEVNQIYPFIVNAWVLLPDHFHCLWTLPDGDGDFSKRWGLIKAGFSRRVTGMLPDVSMPASRIRHRESTIWQRRFWEHEIHNEEDYRNHVDYIHYNPVKHRLVSRVTDWPYSSFHEYVRDGFYTKDWGEDLKPSWEGDFGEV